MISILRIFFYICYILYAPIAFKVIVIDGLFGMERFEVNNDLDDIKPSFHNIMHVVLTFLMGIAFTPIVGYVAMLLYEYTDGFKPRDKDFNRIESNPKFWENFKSSWLYSNKFSLQDIYIWNLSGFILALISNILI